MSENTRSSWSRVVARRIPIVASLAIGSLALVVSAATGSPVGGPLAFGRPADQAASASNNIMYADPNPISVCNGATTDTTLHWNVFRTKQYKIYKDAATEPFKQGVGSGVYTVHGVTVGTTFRIDTYIGRTQTIRVGNRRVQTTNWVKDGSSTVLISLNPATDCAPPVDPNPPVSSFEFVTNELYAGTVGSVYNAKIAFRYHTTGTNYATNATFTGLPAGITTGSSSGPNTILGILPGSEGPDGLASANISGTPSTSGTYTVKLDLTDQHGTNASKSFSIVVNAAAEPPRVTCNPNPQTAKVGEQVVFTAAGGVGGYIWSSSGANPATATGLNYTLSYSSAGSKEVTVRSGAQTATCQVTVTAVVAPPAPVALSCAAASASVEAGKPVVFTATGGDGPNSYFWSAMDATPVINHVFTNSITPSFASYGDGLTPYEYTAVVVVYSGNASAQCGVKVTTPAVPPQPVALDPNASCDSNSYIHPLNVIPNVLGDTSANAKKLIDGDANTVWSGPTNSTSYTVTFDLGDEFKMSKLCLQPMLTNGAYVRYGVSIFNDYTQPNDVAFSDHHFTSDSLASKTWVGLPAFGQGRFVRVSFSPTTLFTGGAGNVPPLAFREIHFIGASKTSSFQVPTSALSVPESIYLCPGVGGPGTDVFMYNAHKSYPGLGTVSSTGEGYNNTSLEGYSSPYGNGFAGAIMSIQLGPNNTPNTYTFRNDSLTATMKVLPEPGACPSTTVYQFDFTPDTANHGVSAYAVVSNAPAGYIVQPTDGISGVFTDSQTHQQTVLPFAPFKRSINRNQFIAQSGLFQPPSYGHVLYTMTFNGKALQREY